MLEAGLVEVKIQLLFVLKMLVYFHSWGLLFDRLQFDNTGVDGGYIGSLSIWSSGVGSDSDLIGQSYSQHLIGFSNGFWQPQQLQWFLVHLLKSINLAIFAFGGSRLLYPISGSWQWGGGWLSEMGFSDFAGSTIVHSVGWAALTGAILLVLEKVNLMQKVMLL